LVKCGHKTSDKPCCRTLHRTEFIIVIEEEGLFQLAVHKSLHQWFHHL